MINCNNREAITEMEILWEYKIKVWMMVVIIEEQVINYRRDKRRRNLKDLRDRFSHRAHFSSNNTRNPSPLVLDNQEDQGNFTQASEKEEDLILDISVVHKTIRLLLFHLECHNTNSTQDSYHQCSIHLRLLSLYPIVLFLALKLRHRSRWRRSLRWLRNKTKSWAVSCRSWMSQRIELGIQIRTKWMM